MLREQEYVGLLIGVAQRSVKLAVQQHARALGLTAQQFCFLNAARELTGASLGEIARRQRMDAPTASRVAEGLARRGLVRTAQDDGARASQALAPLLPQLSATAGYQRTTANAITRPGAPSVGPAGSFGATHSKFDTFNSYSDSINVSQLVFDFGSQPNRWRAAQAQAEAQAATERVTALQVEIGRASC